MRYDKIPGVTIERMDAGRAVPLFARLFEICSHTDPTYPRDLYIVNTDILDNFSAADFVKAASIQLNTNASDAVRLLEWVLAQTPTKPYMDINVTQAVGSSPVLREFDKRAKDAADRKQREEEALHSLVLGTDRDGR